ncbi:MAG: T9SS type A sorting domain-containing protein [Bacteroidota bacterium]
MNKHKLLLLLAWMLAVNAIGQTQLQKWSLSGKNISFSTNSSITPTISDAPLPSGFKPKNSIYDSKGRVLFYVGDWKIYDAFGKSIADLDPVISPFQTPHQYDLNSEYPIVPCIETANSCLKHYYVFYTIAEKLESFGRLFLFAKLVTINNQTGKITATDVKDGSGVRRVLATSSPADLASGSPEINTGNWGHGGMAVSKVSGQNRFLYWVSGKVRKITLSNLNGSNDGISAASVVFDGSNNPLFKFSTREADISSNGVYLLWGTLDPPTTTQEYDMITLNPATGDLATGTGNDNIFTVQTNTVNSSLMRGVEFGPEGTSLYVTTGGLTGDHGIYWKSLFPISSPFQYIPNSNKYGVSQLELARNGLIYASYHTSISDNGSDGLNLSTHTFVPVSHIDVEPTFYYGGFYALPDQIDGEQYDNTVIDFYDIGDLFMAEDHSGPISYTQTSNPFNTSGDRIKVTGTWSFIGTPTPVGQTPLVTVYKFNKMNFSMAQDAKIVIGDNMELWLYGSTFQAADCAGMWDGFQVVGTGKIILVPDLTGTAVWNEIYDARTAITASGGKAKVSVLNTLFNRNITHIKILDYNPYNTTGLDILNSKFLHTQYLRIFENGQQFPTLLQYGTTGIELGGNIVSSSANSLLIDANQFEGGKYAIYSSGIPFRVFDNNDFKNITGSNSIAIYVDMKGRNAKVHIDHAIFTDINQALYAKGQTNVEFSHNTITRAEKHAVELYQNKDRSLLFYHNSYFRFKQSAILLNNNAGTSGSFNNSKIEIHDEVFDNTNFIQGLPLYQQSRPTAVTIMEPGVKTTGTNYQMLRINDNTMTNVAFGVRAYNIAGYQKMDKRYDDRYLINGNPRPDISDIDHNTMTVHANYVPVPDSSHYNSGMLLGNNRGLVAAVNDITSTQRTQWRSSAIYSNFTQQTLLHKNILKAGRGIRGDYFGLGNDFKCNTFIRGVNGISLQDYRMRLSGQTHGIPLVESRDNTYSKTAKENLELYLYRIASTTTNITDYINANQWYMNANPTTLIEPTPSCTPSISCIRKFGAPDLCNIEPLPGDGGGGTKIVYPNPNTQPNLPNDMLYNWQLHYEYERQQKEEGLVHNTIIHSIIDIEELVSLGEDATALGIVTGMQSNIVYEQNYIQLYQILIPARLERNGVLDSPEVAYFKSIASQDPYTAGPSIFLARAVLWQQEGLHYIDMDDRNPGNIGIQLYGEECIGQIPEGFSIRLMNEDGYVYTQEEFPLSVDDEGFVFIPGDMVAALPSNVSYTFVFDDGNYPSPELQTLADWMDDEGNTFYLCNNAILGNSGNKQAANTLGNKNAPKGADNSGVLVFPNPAKESVTVMLPSKEEHTVAVYDIMGRNVHTQKYAQRAVLTTDNYKPGVYLIQVSDHAGNLLETKRILIKP